jgi:SAM-dependent methyltransferase
MFTRILNLFRRKNQESYDFDKSNPLGGGGERVDFIYSEDLAIDKLDIYQINHYRRYEFASKYVIKGDACGDFACGTGYGSAMLAQTAEKVTGADIDNKVIDVIKVRYGHLNNVEFLCMNLLDLNFRNKFDVIVSFETLEHFEENDIQNLLKLFAQGLKKNGKIIFSTPYMQEDDEAARNLGFHRTFYINETKIKSWLEHAGLECISFNYQNYKTHEIKSNLDKKDFIICVAQS